MSLACGLFRRRTPRPEKPRRTRTISIFDPSLDALKRMMKNATVVSPIKLPEEDETHGPVHPSVSELSRHMHDTFERVYHQLRDGEHELSKEKFTKFIKEVQCEPHENDLGKEKFSLGDFVYALAHHYNWDAVAPSPPTDLSKPITNYFINSSHNTYLNGHQLASKSTADAYKNVLLRGCRCVEVDVWSSTEAASHKNGSKSPSGAGHSRALSGSSIPHAAATVLQTVEDTIETARDTAKSYLGSPNPNGHSRSPSSNSRTKLDDPSPRSSVQIRPELDESTERLDPARAPTPRGRRPLPRGEPVVTHGWTLATECGFREVCETVRDYGFKTTDLPIIISLEVHADPAQQEVMVKIMKEVWQDMLIQEPLDGCDPRFKVPKLEELRNKILIKVKRGQAKMPALNDSKSMPMPAVEADNSASDDERAPPPLRGSVSSPPTSPPLKDSNGKVIICQNLSELAVYTRSERFISLDTPQAKKPTHIFSISEEKILDLHEKHPTEVFRHNKQYFMRAFPAGWRINSSNPDPSLFWRKGVQMVAMNWQNLDEGMMLNEGMFAGENGWVLKPPAYLFSDKTTVTLDQAAKHTLDLVITIYAGRKIPTEIHHDSDGNTRSSSAIRSTIKVELHVEKAVKDSGKLHECTYKQQTEPVPGTNPFFGHSGKRLEFRNIRKIVEELSFIRLKVEDASRTVSSPCLAWACIRLDRLQRGYRFIRLMDMKGNEVPGGKLLVNIEKTLR